MSKTENKPRKDGLPVNIIVGLGECPHCKIHGPWKVNRSGFLYLYCSPVHSGGCHISTVAWSESSNQILKKYIKKWQNAAWKKYLRETEKVETVETIYVEED